MSTMVTMASESTSAIKVVIKEQVKHRVNLKTFLEANETMMVLIRNEKGEVVLKDEFNSPSGLISKTYDFNEARFGDYTIEVLVNDEPVKSTTIGENQVTFQDSYKLEVY